VEKRRVLDAVYMGEEELFESYLAMVVDAYNSQPSGERVFYCKGNLAVLRKSLSLARGDPKNI
jgi:hypothetical protein